MLPRLQEQRGSPHPNAASLRQSVGKPLSSGIRNQPCDTVPFLPPPAQSSQLRFRPPALVPTPTPARLRGRHRAGSPAEGDRGLSLRYRLGSYRLDTHELVTKLGRRVKLNLERAKGSVLPASIPGCSLPLGCSARGQGSQLDQEP